MTLSAYCSNSLIRKAVKTVFEQGQLLTEPPLNNSPGRKSLEILNLALNLKNPRKRIFKSILYPKIFNPGVATAKFFYFLSGSTFLDDISPYSGDLERFSDNGISMSGAHGSRVLQQYGSNNQFDSAIDLILRGRSIKRSTIVFWHPHDCMHDSRDAPCIISASFSPRQGKLYGSVHMRANDVLKLFAYDLFEMTMILEYATSLLSLEIGEYHHSGVSMHIRDFEDKTIQEFNSNFFSDHDFSKISIEMKKMPRMENNFRSSLVIQERKISRLAPTLDFEKVIDLVKSIRDLYDPYWAELFYILLIQSILNLNKKIHIFDLIYRIREFIEDHETSFLNHYFEYLSFRIKND